ncbi:hypothetical protein Tco_1237543 [Tanacetum coccineum]
MLTKPQFFYDDTHKQALGYQNPFYLKKAQPIKQTLYDGSVISNQHVDILMIDDEETLILEEVSRSKMLAKQNHPISKEKKINTTPVNYIELNRLSEDFVKIEAPKKLPKVSQVNTSLKKLKYHLGQFDTVVKKQITPGAITEVEWGCYDMCDEFYCCFGDSVNFEMKKSESCNKCLDLEAELVKKIKKMVGRDVYTELSNSFAKLEKHAFL